MSTPFTPDTTPIRRPHFHAKDGALFFLLSRRPHAPVDASEDKIWQALDGKATVADLRQQFRSLDTTLERFLNLGVCEVPQAHFPPNRRRILVIEPHMDDAALSVGGTMWLRRNECEFTVVTLAGHSNFTTYYMLGRDFFDVAEVTALRKAESSLVLRHIGGHHRTLDLLEAPLRYRNGRWTLDWFRKHREVVSAFLRRSPNPRELDEWTSAIARMLANVDIDEIWMPLGLGLHVDHQLTRDACLRLLRTNPHLFQGRTLRFYEDVPYSGDWPQHAPAVLAVLRNAGARIHGQRTDISEAMAQKSHLLSIFGSQFKMSVMGPRVEKAARLARAESFQFGEAIYELASPPTTAIEPFACYLDRERIAAMAQKVAPWLRRHQSASQVTLLVLTPFGRWDEDMQLLQDLFPRAHFEVHLARSRLPETESFSSPRIQLRPIGGRRGSWYATAGLLVLTRPKPLVIIPSPGKEHHARWLSALCPGADSVVAPSLNALMLALQLISLGMQGKKPIPDATQPDMDGPQSAGIPDRA